MASAVESAEQFRTGGSPRTIFARRLVELFDAAGNPTLRQVAAAAQARMKAARGQARGSTASLQRISDWRSGKNVPAQFEPLVPVLLTLVDLTKKSADPVSGALVDLQEWQRLWKAADSWRPESDDANTVCPYRGLASYGRTDADQFFGRAGATAELAELVLGPIDGKGSIDARQSAADGGGMVALVGASGAGKSSLLHAGLIPAVLAQSGDCVVATLTPGARPLEALTEALGDPVADWAVGRRGLLIVDQFEELFTACHDDGERDAFLAALADIAGPHENRWGIVVLAIRADFYAPCLDYPVLEDALKNRDYVLGPMRLGELSEAITGPARAAGLELESGLVELVITELCGLGDHPDRRRYDPGALPLLSHVMAATWQHRERLRLTVAGYRKAGGVTGSVAATAERAWDELTVSQRIEAKPLLLSLVSVGSEGHDTRRRADRAELITRAVDSEAAAAVLETLVLARLVTSDSDSAYFTHEIVLGAWPRLRAWIDEDRVGYLIRQRLESDAVDWAASGSDPALLYRGTRLTTAKEAAGRLDSTEVVAEFLAAAQSSKRRSRRWAAATRTGLALLGVGVLVLAIAAYAQGRLTSEQRDNAMLSAVLTASEGLRSTDPSLSAQLDLVAHRIRPDDQVVNSRLLSTQNLPLATPLTGHTGAIGQIAYHPGGRVLASAGIDRTIRLWDVADSANPRQLGAPLRCPDPATSVAFSPDGAVLAAACGSSIRLWNVENPEHPVASESLLPDGGSQVTAVVFSPDGRILAAANDNRTVTLWDLHSQGRLRNQPLPVGASRPIGGPIRSMVFNPRGNWMAIADDNSVQLWTVADPASPEPLGPSITVAARPIRAIAVSPDGATLAIGTGESSFLSAGIGDATVALWSLADPLRPYALSSVLVAAKSALGSVAFSPDGDAMATGDRAGVTVWNIADRAHPTRLGEQLLAASAPCPEVSLTPVCQDEQNSLVFSADGHTVAAAGTRGVVRLWSLPPAVIGGRLGWSVLGPAFSTSGSMVTGAIDGDATLWDLRDRASVRQLANLGPGPFHEFGAGSSIGRDGRLVATTSGSPPRLRLLEVSDPTHVRTLIEIPNVFAGWLSPSSRYLWTLSDKAPWSFQIWDISDPVRPARLSGPVPAASAPSGAIAVAGMHDGVVATMGPELDAAGEKLYAIKLWDLSNPAEPREVSRITSEPSKPISWFGMNPDGKTLVSLAADTLQAWDITVPSNVRPLGESIATHGLNIQSIDFSPDGLLMATASADSTVRLWDITDRARAKPIGNSITLPSTTSWQLAFDPAGRYLIGTGNGVMSMWDLDVEHAIARICDVTRTVLTREVWQARLPQIAYRPPCGE
ncbi:hypothetical protein ACFQZZ_08360 [Nocardia sp. GCM10030253]|uniref:nSTAND1 domain-containing NTPase n=1 Tax=Nocardia sp. GCM10030253 TaxID=3273404 RepID=UPI00362EDC9B